MRSLVPRAAGFHKVTFYHMVTFYHTSHIWIVAKTRAQDTPFPASFSPRVSHGVVFEAWKAKQVKGVRMESWVLVIQKWNTTVEEWYWGRTNSGSKGKSAKGTNEGTNPGSTEKSTKWHWAKDSAPLSLSLIDSNKDYMFSTKHLAHCLAHKTYSK